MKNFTEDFNVLIVIHHKNGELLKKLSYLSISHFSLSRLPLTTIKTYCPWHGNRKAAARNPISLFHTDEQVLGGKNARLLV